MIEPVFIWQTPPEWLIPSDQQRADHAQVVGTGRHVRQPVADPQAPIAVLRPFPLARHDRGVVLPIARTTGLNDFGSCCPAYFSSAGFGSNVSIWLGPPSMNRKMTLLARGG
jgi:hypothetical protein